MLYIKYMPFRSAVSASRNLRELSAAKEYGYDVAVFSNDHNPSDIVCDFRIKAIYDGTIPVSHGTNVIQKKIRIIMNYLSVFVKTWRLPTGVWSCHDLSSLKIAWVLSLFKIHKPVFIYDSHEYEIGRNATRTKKQIESIKRWECFLMKRCAFSIMVNDTIADKVKEIYSLKTRPVVVRSTPYKWEINEEECKIQRQKFLNFFSKVREY